jgi:hypothetical protein
MTKSSLPHPGWKIARSGAWQTRFCSSGFPNRIGRKFFEIRKFFKSSYRNKRNPRGAPQIREVRLARSPSRMNFGNFAFLRARIAHEFRFEFRAVAATVAVAGE